MATYTVTTPVNFHALNSPVKTGGDVLTINGGQVTIDCDTRYGPNVPAANVGTLSSPTISSTLGGKLILDATAVRLIAYTSGSGTVPAVDTTISNGTGSGKLIGVYSALNVAPTAAGAAMPATGFIKVRQVTGAYAAGALTGITATSSGVDVPGWIEVAIDESATITVPRLGEFRVRGDWFEIGTTSGSAGQTMQVPSNGQANLRVAGVWVETAAGSGVYEPWATSNATYFTTANLGTDARAKVVQDLGGGVIRIGSDGTNNVGLVPGAGRKVRVPNVIITSNTTAARATVTVPNGTIANRPDLTTTSAGVIDIENLMGHAYLLTSQAASVRLVNSAVFDALNTSETAGATLFQNVVVSGYLNSANVPLTLTSQFGGTTITSCTFARFVNASNAYGISASFVNDLTITDTVTITTGLRSAACYGLYLAYCNDVYVTNLITLGWAVNIVTCNRVTLTGLKYADKPVGTSASTPTSLYAVNTSAGCTDITIDGFSNAYDIANMHPYNGLVSFAATTRGKVRNIGSTSTRYNCGSANAAGVIVNHGGNCNDIRIQRVYVQNTRTGLYATLNSDKNITYESVRTDDADTPAANCLNMIQKNVRIGGTVPTAFTAVYGTHFWDHFISDTVGRVGVYFNEPTTETAAYVTTSFGTGSSFTSTGACALVNSGDYVIFELPYWIKGHTSFQNVAATTTVTGSHTFEYQIDTGAGWNGTWKTVNGTNLSGETVDPVDGFRIKFKVTATASAPSNSVSRLYVTTNSTLTAQTNAVYPLDPTVATFTLTGLEDDTEVRVYNDTTGVEITGIENTTGGSFDYTYDYEVDIPIYVVIHALGYLPIRFEGLTLSSTDQSIPVQQIVDRQYSNPV